MSCYDLNDLEVVAYADKVPELLAPCIVPPVFRFKGMQKFLSPPFEIDGRWVMNGTVVDSLEFDRLVEGEWATLLGAPIEAKFDHELVVDNSHGVSYLHFSVARELLFNLADEQVDVAERLIKEERWEDAEEVCRRVIMVDVSILRVYVLAGFLEKVKQNRLGYQLMAESAERLSCSRKEFDFMVDRVEWP